MKKTLTLAIIVIGFLLAPAWVMAQWSEQQEGELLIRGGWLFDSVSDERRPNSGIVISNGRIAAVDVDAARLAAATATVIELAETDTVLPGMIDLHAHYNLDLVDKGRVEEVVYNGIVFLANGVTSTWSAGEYFPERVIAQRDRIDAGESVGPRLFASGPYFGAFRCEYNIGTASDDCIGWPNDITEEEIREEVDYWAGQGVISIKIKQATPEEMRIIIEQAHQHGMTTAGHLANYDWEYDVELRDAILMGLDRVEHQLTLGSGGPDSAEMPEMIELMLEHDVFYDANLQMYGGINERRAHADEMLWTNEARFFTPYAQALLEKRGEPEPESDAKEFAQRVLEVKSLYEAGGAHLLIVGTDEPVYTNLLPGFAYHRELLAMTYAGIPPAVVLKAATINGARALGIDDRLGSIEAGKLADLYVVRGDPLDDIKVARDIKLVVKDGTVYDPAELLRSAEGKIGPQGPDDHAAWELEIRPLRKEDASATAAFQAPIKYIPSALGPYSWKITTSSEMAQKLFDQGLQMRYAFGMDDAARSFRQAHREDPNCAMCYWGEAFALGSFLNGGMTVEKAPHAHVAIEKAFELSGNITELEHDLILAARDRYPSEYDPDNRRAVDEAFAERMHELYEKYPGNHDVAVIYAVSLFLLEERRGYRDINDPDLIYLHEVLTGVLDDDITHPGACHLYIHATESSQEPELALPCAEFLSDAVPAASHIQHMPSHTWNEVGYWGKSVRANIRARHSDLKSRQGEGFSYAPGHNLHMLLFAASMDGQGAVATQAGKDYAKETGNTMYQVLTLLRFGRYDEIPAVTDRPSGEIAGGFWDFAQGYAAAQNDDPDLARDYLRKVQTVADESTAKFRMHDASQLMGLSAAILDGEIKRLDGDLEGAIAAFRRAADLDDQQTYDEPEPIPYAARHWLGAALLEAGRYADAEQVYRTELADHPHNVWSLTGLKAALDGQGRKDPEVDADFDESTSRMDVWITSSII